jgi:hypothetical protein
LIYAEMPQAFYMKKGYVVIVTGPIAAWPSPFNGVGASRPN